MPAGQILAVATGLDHRVQASAMFLPGIVFLPVEELHVVTQEDE